MKEDRDTNETDNTSFPRVAVASVASFLSRPLVWFLAALAIRLLYLAEQAVSSPLFYRQLLDEAEVTETARLLLQGAGFGPEPLFKAPLYPLFLAGTMAATGPEWLWVARLTQHLAGAALVLLAYDSARRLTGARGAGTTAGALAAAAVTFCGPLIRLENRLVLDFWTVFLQSAMLWALVRAATTVRPAHRPRWILAAGALAALGWLNRPTLLPVLPFLALWLAGGLGLFRFFRTSRSQRGRIARRLGRAGLFLLPPLLAIAAFGLRNRLVGGETLFLPWQGGFNFYQANREGANGRYFTQKEFSFNRTGNPTRELILTGFEKATAPDRDTEAARPARAEVNSYWYALARRDIAESPLRWIGLMARKTLYLLSAREIFNFEDYETQKQLSGILPFAPVGFGLLWPFALASAATLAFLPRQRRRLHGLMWLYAILLGGAIALFFASGRFRMPLVFPAVVVGASGVAALTGRLARAARSSSTPLPLGRIFAYGFLCVVGLFLSWTDWWGARSENVRHFEYARLSNAYWQNGQPEKALEFADRCRREDPAYPTVPLLRGQALYALGRMDEAAAAFEQSTRRLPDDPVAPFNLGIIAYYHRDRPAEALRLFFESLRIQPDYRRAAWMAVRAHLRLGQPEDARNLFLAHRNADDASPSGPADAARRAGKDYLITAALLHQALGDAPGRVEELRRILRENYGPTALEELEEEDGRILDRR